MKVVFIYLKELNDILPIFEVATKVSIDPQVQ